MAWETWTFRQAEEVKPVSSALLMLLAVAVMRKLGEGALLALALIRGHNGVVGECASQRSRLVG
jgi:hypothetical protein